MWKRSDELSGKLPNHILVDRKSELMLKVIFTLDYEIHGNGQGFPYDLMVEPTNRMLDMFSRYGAKLTIFPDVAEIIKFGEYKDYYGRDEYCYDNIIKQLQRTVKTGHDVQLHIHSSYFNAIYKEGQWLQDWSEYSFSDLPYERISWMIRIGKKFLESILKPVDQRFRCIAFRAANWSVNPSENIARTLIENDIKIDTSVFKYGQRKGINNFNYSYAHNALIPWIASNDDFCCFDPGGQIWEFPIYSEKRWIGAFITLNRFYRALQSRLYKIPNTPTPGKKSQLPSWSGKVQSIKRLFLSKHAWKADFNQCSGRQLIQALIRAEKQVLTSEIIPFILIGHSKTFTRWNERSIKTFLEFVARHSNRFSFGTFSTLNPIFRK